MNFITYANKFQYLKPKRLKTTKILWSWNHLWKRGFILKRQITCSDAMLSGAGSAHWQSSESHFSVDVFAELVLLLVVRLEQKHGVEVTVTNVAENRSWNKFDRLKWMNQNIFFRDRLKEGKMIDQ